MRVFVRNIPVDTKPDELSEYILRLLNKGILALFLTPGKISNIKIVAQQDNTLHTIKFHGLVTIENDSAARRLIKHMRWARFKGRRVAVREFVPRTWHNDRREQNEYVDNLSNNRRIKDRRQCVLEPVTQIEVSSFGLSSFSPRLGF